MKFKFLVICFFIPAVLLSSKNDSLIVNSKISQVTVYLNGAEISRTARKNLPVGRNTLVFNNLSSHLSYRNIRFVVPDEIKVLSLITDNSKMSAKGNMKKMIKHINDSIELMNNKISLLDNQNSALMVELKLLNVNNDISKSEQGVVIEELKKAADFYRSRVNEINDKMFKLELKKREINKVKDKLSKRKYKYNKIIHKAAKQIILEVSAEKAGIYNFEFKYYVYSAGWKPSYDIKAIEIGKNINFDYNAKVYNNTGVDWNNVNLVLSTADPAESASKPGLTPWTLNFSSDVSNEGYVQSKYVGSADRMELDIAEESLGETVVNTPNTVTVSELSAEFIIESEYTVPSNAKPYLIDVTEYKLPAKYKHLAIPKIERDAFLLARISGWEDLDIIDGEANIYFGNMYIGKSYINTRFVEDTLDLSLGRDKKVLVTRSKKKDFNSKKIFGLNKKESYLYEIIVKNNRKNPVEIDILDQIPISQEDDIKVDVLNISNAIMNEQSGKLTWSYKLNPGEIKKIELSFSIKYPKKKKVKTRKFRSISCPSF